jgi:hypothetical protein
VKLIAVDTDDEGRALAMRSARLGLHGPFRFALNFRAPALSSEDRG